MAEPVSINYGGVPLDEAKAAVRAAGYMVVKIPDCKYGERQHGRHELVCHTAMCEGSEVLPHAHVDSHRGSFGWWERCACGREFSDYGPEGEPTNWEKHKAEFIDAPADGLDAEAGEQRG